MYNQFAKQLGNIIREYREKLQLPQEVLADKAEISRSYIGAVERAERVMSLKTLFKISRALEVDCKDLFDFDKL